MFAKLALRDLVITAVALGVWWAIADLSAGPGLVADVTGVVAGVLLGVVAYLFHEWGHLLGAFATRSVVRASDSLRSPFVFNFDAEHNSLAQFVTMSLAGFAATGVAIWVVYGHLPDELLASRVARGGVLFLAGLGITLEVPLLAWGIVRGGVPSAVAVKGTGPNVPPR